MSRFSWVALLALIGCGGGETEEPADDCAASLKVSAWADADGDGDGDPATETEVCDLSPGLVANGDDCDDSDPGIHFSAPELCDGIDQDCDGTPDDGLLQRTFYADDDGDGYGDASQVVKGCERPDGASDDSTDCDDAHADAHPGAPEVCDGYDNDCNALADDEDPGLDPAGASTWYRDTDRDGFGDDATSLIACANPNPQLWIADGGDCDDTVTTISPASPEVCDRVDNNCDTLVDEADPALDPAELQTFYEDLDGDGFGDDTAVVEACFPGAGLSPVGGDCDDANPALHQPTQWVYDNDADGYGGTVAAGPPSCTSPGAGTVPQPMVADCDDARALVHPGASETCDGLDDDCDTLVDDADPSIDPAGMISFYRDADQDGYGTDLNPTRACVNPNPALYAAIGGDCNDANAAANPAGTEVCDHADNDCDTLVDDADPGIDPALLSIFYSDADGDGVGDDASFVEACFPGAGAAADGGDCDDNDASIGLPPEWVDDLDGDGVGAGPVVAPASCLSPGPNTAPLPDVEDCDEADPTVYPGATETCGDGIDQDCSGADVACGPIGKFDVFSGPPWGGNPPVYSCLDACALLFGGVAADYQCSTSSKVVDNQAFVSGWGDAQFCTKPVAETTKKPIGGGGYNCGAVGCSYSAYVQDNCFQGQAINYCWPH